MGFIHFTPSGDLIAGIPQEEIKEKKVRLSKNDNEAKNK